MQQHSTPVSHFKEFKEVTHTVFIQKLVLNILQLTVITAGWFYWLTSQNMNCNTTQTK